MSEVAVLANALVEQFGNVTLKHDYGWPCPALNVLDCVLSLHRLHNSFAIPRMRSFAERHPEVIELKDLQKLIESYDSPALFSIHELDYNDAPRAQILYAIVQYLITIQRKEEGSTEQERLQCWAISVSPDDSASVGVKGFGLSGFQYMRMLFGAQTTKPDVHIKRFVSEVTGRAVSDRKTLGLLEQAAKIAHLPL